MQIDFFASDAVNPSGFGDGQTYLESIAVFVDDSGSAQFQIPLDDAVPAGQWITATATDSTGTPRSFPRQSRSSRAAAADAVGFSAPAYLVTETGGAAVVTVNRVGSTAGTATVDYTTEDGSALAGTNYTAESGTLTFAAGQDSQTITIPIQDDGIATPDLSFQIVLENPTGTSLGSVTDAVVTIADAESAGVLSFSTAGETTLESRGAGAAGRHAHRRQHGARSRSITASPVVRRFPRRAPTTGERITITSTPTGRSRSRPARPRRPSRSRPSTLYQSPDNPNASGLRRSADDRRHPG